MTKSLDEAKQRGLSEAIAELDRLNQTEYLELQGGRPHHDGGLTGGKMVFRRGLANWHTREAQALLALKYRVEQGHWTGPDDHARTPFTAEPLPLKRMLGALHLDNLADFLETAAEASPETVEQVRTQACDALITGDVAALKVTGIDREYSLKNHLAAFDRNESYIFMNDKGTIEFRKPERNDAGTEPAGQIAEILDKS